MGREFKEKLGLVAEVCRIGVGFNKEGESKYVSFFFLVKQTHLSLLCVQLMKSYHVSPLFGRV